MGWGRTSLCVSWKETGSTRNPFATNLLYLERFGNQFSALEMMASKKSEIIGINVLLS